MFDEYALEMDALQVEIDPAAPNKGSSMMKRYCTIGVAGALLIAATGCENLPGDERSQGAVIGGVSGAAVGAAVGGAENRVLGALLGGAMGAGVGYLIGANWDKITGKDSAGAQAAAREAQSNPATVQDAQRATTADLNSDGFVTLDEVVAMEQAGFSDEKILQRLRATDQIFELTEQQKNHLRSRGVSEYVIAQLATINQNKREELLRSSGTQEPIISRERSLSQ
ncbi:MAG: glycine zipper domain-containing protein [Verrucomicrobia subdivision 3 bacterium]|nr:glycine zipper domain-containing protein [Limisphaerales bacterium]